MWVRARPREIAGYHHWGRTQDDLVDWYIDLTSFLFGRLYVDLLGIIPARIRKFLKASPIKCDYLLSSFQRTDESCGLDWHDRYKIIKGVCRGLHYLHEEITQNTPIIHSDLKPANILLTNEMEPKITDFGQSRLFGEQQSRTYTKSLVGTL